MRTKVLFVSLMVSLFFVGQAIGQGNKVSGKVISGEDRTPLLGVNVVVKNTTKGATTDNDGKFVVENVSPQDTLVFSYIGFQREQTPIRGRDVINLTLTPQAVAGDAVVVIGYGTQQRRDITSAVSSLQDFAFNQGATTDPQNLLQGRIPGVVVTQTNGDVGA
ncbi:MAG: carboxypeptidase-like regulatory domain-containing protein, partial [Nitrososphaera sp.]